LLTTTVNMAEQAFPAHTPLILHCAPVGSTEPAVKDPPLHKKAPELEPQVMVKSQLKQC
jgi:hypothetical protein